MEIASYRRHGVQLAIALVASASIALTAGGCAESVGDIDRTQPNVVRKSLLSGIWYYRETITDVPATSSFTFVGETGEMEKIRWEIQEDKLIAYRAYELVPGSDTAVDPVDKAPGSSRYRPSAREGRTPDAYKENPVAAFAIQKHFDITRSYNAQTGEQSNVLTENDTDRPWYQRAFMRVDWSKNLVMNFNFLSAFTSASPVSYVQENEGGADAFYMEDADGARVSELRHPKEIGYFDFTTKVFVEPDEYGCILRSWGLSYEDCTSAELKVRHSFGKIMKESEYEPLPYSDRDQAKFGYFRTERVSYDRNRGATESGRIYLANRHNVWKESYVKDAAGNPVTVCASAFRAPTNTSPAGALDLTKVESFVRDEANGKVGVACGADAQTVVACNDAQIAATYQTGCLALDRVKVSMPYALREPKPVVYHLSPQHPIQLIPALDGVAASWNRAFRKSVALAMGRPVELVPEKMLKLDYNGYREFAPHPDRALAGVSYDEARPSERWANGNRLGTVIMRYQRKPGEGDGAIDANREPLRCAAFDTVGDQKFYAECLSNAGWTWDSDARKTRVFEFHADDVKARLGDVRRNFVYWVDSPQLSSPWGYGPSSADPETGEIISGMAYVYGAPTDLYATHGVDIVKVMNNKLKIQDLIDGTNVRDEIARNLDRTDPRSMLGDKPLRVKARGRAAAEAKIFGGDRASRIQYLRRNGFPAGYRGWLEDRMKRAKDTSFGQKLMNQDEILLAAGVNPLNRGQTVTPRQKEKMAAAVYGMPALMRKRKERLHKALKNNVTLAEFADDALIGLALEFATKYDARYEQASVEAREQIDGEVRNEIRTRIYRSVMEHEVGHTLGLRHNFQGSFDSVNYFDDYWTLRKETLKGSEGGDGRNPASSAIIWDGDVASEFNFRPALEGAAQSEAQKRGKMREFQYSTVMDYGARLNSDIHGTGKYDDAAIVYAYTGGSRIVPRRDIKSESEMFPARPSARTDRFFCPNGAQASPVAKDEWRCVEPGFVETFANLPRTYAKLGSALQTFNNRPAPVFESLTEVIHYAQLPYLLGGGALKGICADGSKCDVCFIADDANSRESSAFEGAYAFSTGNMTACQSATAAPKELWLSYVEGGDASTGIAALKTRQWKRAAAVERSGTGPVEVPYLFCSDEYIGATSSCQLWDTGADTYEITHAAIDMYESNYFFNNFKRDRFGFDTFDVFMRVYERYFQLFPNVYQNWLLYGDTPGIGFNHYSLDQAATYDGFNQLVNVVARPRYGTYRTQKTTGRTWSHCSYLAKNETGCQEYELDRNGRPDRGRPRYDLASAPVGVGRRLYTRYDYASGYNLFDKPLESGHYWDFLAALYAIADSEATVVGAETSSDLRTFLLSYYLVFEGELTKFYNGLILDDGVATGARLNPQPDGMAKVFPTVGYDYIKEWNGESDDCQLAPESAGCTLIAPSSMKPVSTSTTWMQQIDLLYMGMAGFSETWSISFVDQAKVFRLGAGEALDPGQGHTVVKFTDPKKGVEYAALKKNGVTEEAKKSLAVRLIEQGKALYTRWVAAADEDKRDLESQISELSDLLDIVRGMVDVYSRTW